MRIDLISKEYPPAIYGGAGVHVAELVRVLRRQIDVQVRCFGEERNETDTFAYRHPSSLEFSNPAVQTLATDLEMVEDIAGADLVHSHTWYANFAGQVANGHQNRVARRVGLGRRKAARGQPGGAAGRSAVERCAARRPAG